MGSSPAGRAITAAVTGMASGSRPTWSCSVSPVSATLSMSPRRGGAGRPARRASRGAVGGSLVEVLVLECLDNRSRRRQPVAEDVGLPFGRTPRDRAGDSSSSCSVVDLDDLPDGVRWRTSSQDTNVGGAPNLSESLAAHADRPPRSPPWTTVILAPSLDGLAAVPDGRAGELDGPPRPPGCSPYPAPNGAVSACQIDSSAPRKVVVSKRRPTCSAHSWPSLPTNRTARALVARAGAQTKAGR